MTSAPSSTVVWAERDTPSVRVPAPVFVSSPVVGALIVAATSSFTLTIAAVSVEEPPTVVLARKSTRAADTSPLTVAESSAVLNTAVLPFCHADAVFPNSHGVPPVHPAPAEPPFHT